MGLTISKVIGQMLLPPGILLLAILLGLAFFRRRWGRGLVALSALLLWLLALAPVRDLLVRPLENAYPPLPVDHAQRANAQAIVLLGGGVYIRAPEFGGEDALQKYSLMRTAYASELAKRTGLDVYASGGKVFIEDARPEGEVMVEWLARFGVPDGRLHAENASRTTWENAMRLQAMLEPLSIRRIILVTSAYHMPRAVRAFQAHGFEVLPAPCAYKQTMDKYVVGDWLPRADVFSESSDALHEYLGMLWYSLRPGF